MDMTPNWIVSCCGGSSSSIFQQIHFITVPGIGLTEIRFLSAMFVVIFLLISCWNRVSSCLKQVFPLLLFVVLLVFSHPQASSSASISSWIGALNDATIHDGSTSITQWCSVMNSRQQRKSSHSYLERPLLIPNVLTPQEIKFVVDTIKDSKHLHIHMNERAGPLPTFIFGTYWMYLSFNSEFPSPSSMQSLSNTFPSIEHITGPLNTRTTTYEELHVHFNKLLLAKFGFVYDAVRKSLARELKTDLENVVFEENWALPGFNIFYSHLAFSRQVFQTHIDGEWSPIRSTYSDCDDDERVTFTLTLANPPKSGGGLSFWEIDNSLCDESFVAEMINKNTCSASCFNKSKVLYEPGSMVVHKGYVIHAISPWSYISSTDMRITLQGFSCFCDGKWRFSW